uniref:UPAR/Ly6 domain-containing protein n=1 Tax=Knipowitschia caucasica TaxID=637954 RepID=A0AAV2KTW0_KNICA
MWIVLVLVTFSLRLHSVWALNCITCNFNDTSCTSPSSQTCTNGETMCVTATIITWTIIVTATSIKGCAAPSVCTSTGDVDFSLFTGTEILARASCCNSDDCNAANAAAPNNGISTSLTCYSCDLSGVCNASTVTCFTLETACFSSSVIPATGGAAVPTHGCASQSFSTGAPSSSVVLLLMLQVFALIVARL